MTWTAKTLPDNALDPASLVGTMRNSQPTPNPALIGSSAPANLCDAMAEAYCIEEMKSMEEAMADVLEVVRDWLLPSPSRWYPHRDLHARLTEQINIARNS